MLTWKPILAALGIFLTCAGPGLAEVPDFVESAHWPAGTLAWVSEDFALDDDGHLDLSLFHPGDQQSLQDLVSENNNRYQQKIAERLPHKEKIDSCQIFKGGAGESHGPAKTIAELAASSALVITGEITHLKQGFLHGRPGTVYEIGNSKVIKGIGDDTQSDFFVFLPIAEIRTNDGYICATNLRRDPPPTIDSRVLMFLFSRVLNRETVIIAPPDEGVFFQNSREDLSLPASWSFAEKQSYDINHLIQETMSLAEARAGASASGSSRGSAQADRLGAPRVLRPR